ncbi:MAG: dehydratase [Rhodobacteraceae bacterium]|jgi:acyl dehydratase|nr:dehydratase [Paracoccaceae bacterium]
MNLLDLKAGAELPPLAIGPITRRSLALFAGASGDHQPVHIDLDAAHARGRPDVIAHGMLSMAYLGRYLDNLFPQERLKSFSARFAAVTPVLAEPVCRGRVETVENGEAILDLTVALGDGTVTVRGRAVVDLS